MTDKAQQALKCLDCEADIALPDTCVIGEIIPCGECGCEMEVASLDPVVLEMAPEIEEDWGE